jgi:hypothetical protein
MTWIVPAFVFGRTSLGPSTKGVAARHDDANGGRTDNSRARGCLEPSCTGKDYANEQNKTTTNQSTNQTSKQANNQTSKQANKHI